VAQYTWFGFLGKIDLAVVEVAGILPDGRLIPSTSIGNNKTWLDLADKVILEVNSTQPLGLDGMHDIYYGTALPPNRQPIPLTQAGDRIGEPYLRVDPAKVVAVVETHAPDGWGVLARRTKPASALPAIWLNSSSTKSRWAVCRKTCCPCSLAWAILPMRCWAACVMVASPI
jgi:acyl-CoA hydrolase